jgi:hypothetical protein
MFFRRHCSAIVIRSSNPDASASCSSRHEQEWSSTAPRFERSICEVRHSQAEKAMEPRRLKVNREGVDASGDAEIRMASLWTNNNGQRRRFRNGLVGQPGKGRGRRISETARCALAEGHKRRPPIGRVLTEALDVGAKTQRGISHPNWFALGMTPSDDKHSVKAGRESVPKRNSSFVTAV